MPNHNGHGAGAIIRARMQRLELQLKTITYATWKLKAEMIALRSLRDDADNQPEQNKCQKD
jgi:hypothetical protein